MKSTLESSSETISRQCDVWIATPVMSGRFLWKDGKLKKSDRHSWENALQTKMEK